MMRSIGKFIVGVVAVGTMALTGATLAGAAPLNSTVAVTIDGQPAGATKFFSGLPMQADIVPNDLSPDSVRVLLGADMGSAWSSWLSATSTQGFVERDLSTVSPQDPSGTLTFHDALVTSVTIPKLDGSSKESGYFDVEFEPEVVKWSTGPANPAKPAAPGKLWHTANFKLEVAGLPTSHVTSVDGFTWRQTVVRDSQGKFIGPANVGDSMQPTALRFTIDAVDAPAWSAWQAQFVQSKVTRSGSLKIYTADMQSYATLELKNVGIVAVTPAPEPARFNVELYVEKMAFKLI